MPKGFQTMIKLRTKKYSEINSSEILDFFFFGGGDGHLDDFETEKSGPEIETNEKVEDRDVVRTLFWGLAWHSVWIQLRLWSLQIRRCSFSTLHPQRGRRTVNVAAHSAERCCGYGVGSANLVRISTAVVFEHVKGSAEHVRATQKIICPVPC